jgi:single-stranded-DNA-specific exonuclease
MLVNHYVVGGKHLSVKVRLENGLVVSGIYYNYDVRNWPNNSVRQVRMVFGFDLSKNRCDASLKLIIRNMEPLNC